MQARIATRIAAVALGSLAYVLGSHWLMTRSDGSPWDVVGVLAPMLGAVAFGAWRTGQGWLCGAAVLAIAGLSAEAWRGVQVPAATLYLAQHTGVHALLAFGFGSTLRAGRTPLISTMAARVHRQLTPAMAVYTRKVTLAWTLYFVAMALVSIGLFVLAPFDAWALFANLLTPLAVVAMFAAEYGLRYRLHPEFERTSVADAVRSYRAGGAQPASAPQDRA